MYMEYLIFISRFYCQYGESEFQEKWWFFTQTCMNVVYFTLNVCNVSCHFFSSMDRNDFYLITVIFSEYMTYVCTNFLRLCESEGIEYCYSRWL